jgi:Holliday junction resolvasome RuvABC endonuclease subunit
MASSAASYIIAIDPGTTRVGAAVLRDAGGGPPEILVVHRTDVSKEKTRSRSMPGPCAEKVRDLVTWLASHVPAAAHVEVLVENQFKSSLYQANIIKAEGMLVTESQRLADLGFASVRVVHACGRTKFAHYQVPGAPDRGGRKRAAHDFIERYIAAYPPAEGVLDTYYSFPRGQRHDMADALMMALARVDAPAPPEVQGAGRTQTQTQTQTQKKRKERRTTDKKPSKKRKHERQEVIDLT